MRFMVCCFLPAIGMIVRVMLARFMLACKGDCKTGDCGALTDCSEASFLTEAEVCRATGDPVEKFFDVEVHHDAMPRRNQRLRRAHRLMRRAFGPKPVARR